LTRVKIYELAKELSMESKDIMHKLQKMGVEAKSHMSSISESNAEMIRQSTTNKSAKDKTVVDNGFVPKVTRIPRAVVEQEQVQVQTAIKEKEEKEAALAVEQQGQKTETEIAQSSENKKAAAPSQPAPQTGPVSATKPDPQVEAKPEAQPQAVAVPKTEDKPIAETQAETKPELKPEANAQAQPQTQTQSQPQIKTKPQTDSARTGAKPETRPFTKTEVNQKPGFGQETRPAPRPRQEYSPQSRPAARPQNNQSRPPFGEIKPTDKDKKFDGNRPVRDQQRPPRPFTNNQAGEKGGAPQQSHTPSGRTDGRPVTKDNRGGRDNKPATGKPAAFTAPTTDKTNSNYRVNRNKPAAKDLAVEKDNDFEQGRSKNFRSNKNRRDNRFKKQKQIMPPVVPKKIFIGETVILGELAKTMGKTAGEIIKKLFETGYMATINQELDAETAILIAGEFGVTVEIRTDKAEEIMEDMEDDEANLCFRPPVVTIMGHVDHGKTSLLDAIRHTNVISTEAGGITQHIGAYQVEINGKKITFLDTPGHEAFTAMRARGAQVTDIAIIVVAADDGVMPQTIEAINHSKAAHVPIIIAINKIDKPGANPDRVKQELMEYGLVAEEWGGETIMVPVSAKARENIEGLLEMILLVAEVGELKANPDRQARGTVIEAKLDKNRGPLATLLIQKGTLNLGDSILAGPVFGKVKAMNDDKGRKVKVALPSMPVEVLGFSETPAAGEIFIAVKDDKDARFVAYKQQIKKREEGLTKTAKVSLDDLFEQIAQGEIKELNLVVKGDVQGSVEALKQSLVKLNTDEVKVNVIHASVGGVSESDVMLASASNAIIIGFNVRPASASLKAAEHENVDIRLYRVIYDAIEDIKKAMTGLLDPKFKEQVIGQAEVRSIFKVPKVGVVAGGYVVYGKITRNALVRVIRDSVVVAEDKIDSLRRFKDDAKEVLSGFECGIGLESFGDIKEGDIIEAYVMEEIKREL